jgi:hypothetical protein
MALTIEQESALLALLSEKRTTLPELSAATEVAENDLFLINQQLADKSVTASVIKQFTSPLASLTSKGVVSLSNAIDSASEAEAVTPKALTLLPDLILPVGIPLPWPDTMPPTGFLKCNGAAFDKAKYPKLAKAYPNGKLPDLRGEFIRGWDDSRGVDVDRTILSWQQHELILHGHPTLLSHESSGSKDSIGAIALDMQHHLLHEANSEIPNIGSWDNTRTNPVGGFGGNETRPRNIAFLYIVRAA